MYIAVNALCYFTGGNSLKRDFIEQRSRGESAEDINRPSHLCCAIAALGDIRCFFHHPCASFSRPMARPRSSVK